VPRWHRRFDRVTLEGETQEEKQNELSRA